MKYERGDPPHEIQGVPPIIDPYDTIRAGLLHSYPDSSIPITDASVGPTQPPWEGLLRGLAGTYEGLGYAKEELGLIGSGVYDAHRLLINDQPPAQEHEPVRGFTADFRELLAHHLPGTSQSSIARELYMSETQLAGYLTGDRDLKSQELERILNRLEVITGRSIASEIRNRVLERGRAANDIPRTQRQRLEKALRILGDALSQATATINRVAAAQATVAVLEEELTQVLASATYDVRTRMRIPTRREQKLRRRLAAARTELEAALRKQHENVQELRDRAQVLSDLVGQYLETLPTVPPRRMRPRRRAVRRHRL